MKSVLFGLILLPGWLSAQHSWLHGHQGSSITAGYLRPSFEKDNEVTPSGSTILFTGRIAVSEGTYVIAEIPIVKTKIEYSYFSYTYDSSTGAPIMVQSSASDSKSSIGNIMLGIEFGSQSSRGNFRFVLPTLSREKAFAGISGYLGDFPHLERYVADVVILLGGYAYQPVFENGITALLAVGPSAWFPVGENQGETEFMLDYEGGIGYEYQWARFGISVGGRVLLTEDELLADKNALHHMRAEVNFRFGNVQPGLSFQLPLESELSDHVRSTLGFRIQFLF